ncbi:MAG: T9SS type A sorting domain-containing protein [Bacteroidetes bacterium]|nr:T9SS type A sorting domain-containing protein [Bacteroidota bacterium]
MKLRVIFLLALIPLVNGLYSQNPEWKVYNTANSGLGDNDLRSISIDNNDEKWVGTVNDAVYSYDDNTWDHYNSSNSYVYDDYVLCISTDSLNHKWIGTRSGGMSKYDGSQWYFWDETHSAIPDNKVYDIQFEGPLTWVATMHGLASFDGSTWTTWNTANSGIPAEEVRAIAFDGSGNKWIATWGGGIAKFDGSGWTVYNKSNSPLPDNYCISLFYDGNFFWIGTSGNGLARFDGTSWTIFTTSNSGIPSDFVFNSKKEGNKLWFATGAGMALLEGTTWTVYNPSNSGLPGQYTKDIEIDASGNKWIATDQGLAEFRQGGVLGLADPVMACNEQLNITIAPNPVTTFAKVSWEDPLRGEAHFSLINPLGQILPLETIPAVNHGRVSITLDLSGQKPGFYFLKCQVNNKLITKKIVLIN